MGNHGSNGEYKHPNKRSLAEANLNRFFGKWKEEKNLLPFEEAINDTKVFLEKYFSISQKKYNQTYECCCRENILFIIKDAWEDKRMVDFKFVQSGSYQCQTEVRLIQQTDRINLPNWSS